MPATLEREIKLRFDDLAAARGAVIAAGGTLLRARRLQHDCLLDTPDGALRSRRSILRVRADSARSVLTFKGPVQPSAMKLREEIEVAVGDAALAVRLLDELGFHVWFRYEKYREEFALGDVTIAIDETPVGTYVELEGSEQGIAAASQALGRGPADYVLDSYRGLFVRFCEARTLPVTDMLFAAR
jgi:adenylate cyclase class 2